MNPARLPQPLPHVTCASPCWLHPHFAPALQLDGRNKDKDAAVVELLTQNGYRMHAAGRKNTVFTRPGFVPSTSPDAAAFKLT